MRRVCINYIYIYILIGLFSVLFAAPIFAEEVVNYDATDTVTITVPVSCNLTSTVDSAHSATIANGTYKEGIGTTTFTAFCNDDNGYSIYAIGYSNDEYGNTKLLNSAGDTTSDINTDTNTSGNTSSWAMKINPVAGTYAPNIVNGFNNYSLVPNTYTKVATFPSITDNMIGSKFQSTYSTFITGTQKAGTYIGKVKYTLVHPAGEAPLQPVETPAGKIGYVPNASGVVDTMGDQTTTGYTSTVSNFTTPLSDNSEATLWASNFQRPGYGFAGWSTAFDYSGTTYGPNETITTPADLSTNGLTLYAIWVKSAGAMQNWQGCNSMSIGNVTALTDLRDNDTYAVAKLADGNCWMIENLRLDYDANENSTGSLAQGYATSTTYGDFKGLAEPETTNFISDSANSLYYSGAQSGTATINIGTTNFPRNRFPRYNNTNTNSLVANMTEPNQNVYSYGNYYTWSAAVADVGYYAGTNQTITETSICPKGWRLPSGGNDTNSPNSIFRQYSIALIGYDTNGKYGTTKGRYDNDDGTTKGTDASNALREYPNNFLYSGIYGSSSTNSRGESGEYISSTVFTNGDNFRLSIFSTRMVYPGSGGRSYDDYGQSIRCLAD